MGCCWLGLFPEAALAPTLANWAVVSVLLWRSQRIKKWLLIAQLVTWAMYCAARRLQPLVRVPNDQPWTDLSAAVSASGVVLQRR